MDGEARVALVTGSTRGIGAAIARRLAADGCDIVVHGRRSEGPSAAGAEALAQELRQGGRRVETCFADVTDKAAVGGLLDEVQTRMGRLDVLVLNAARAPFKESARLLDRDLRELVGTNLLAPIYCMQKSLPLLEKQGGAIVFISSLGSRFMNPRYPLGPMKAAMEAMMRQWAEELRDSGIRANAVCAGLVKTDAFATLRRLWPGLASLPESLFVAPEEVAAAVSFLSGPDAAAVTGQTLVVDHGLSNRVLRDPTT